MQSKGEGQLAGDFSTPMTNNQRLVVRGEEGDALSFRVRVSPAASRDRVVGIHAGALKVSVRAPAERGRANSAVIELLAGLLGVPAGCIVLVAGGKSKDKRVRVIRSGLDKDELHRRLAGAG